MAELWLPGAERRQKHSGGGMVGGPPRVTAHITWDKLGSDGHQQATFDNVAHYLLEKNFEPHFLVDVFSGRIMQFVPANKASYALRHPSGTPETNRRGTVNLQIEIFFTPGMKVNGKTYHTVAETPMKGLDKIAKFAESWGVPTAWAVSEPTWDGHHRSVSDWQQKKGWFGHSQVPNNTHTDPGPLNLKVIHDRIHGAVTPVAPKPAPSPAPKPAATTPTWYHRVLKSQKPLLVGGDVKVVQKKVGLTGGAVDGKYGNTTAAYVEAWQHRHGLTADGVVGPNTATKMGN